MMETNPWERRFERERKARKEAEQLLEQKSREIWEINQALEQKVLERTDELSEALRQAREANRAKDVFLSNMSHELRTPLNAIIGFSQILMARKETPETIRSYIEKINISGEHLLELVNTILDFAKIEAGKMDYAPQRIEPDRLRNELRVILEPMAHKAGVAFSFEWDELLPFMGDYQLIKQLFINLISNAVKFSHADGRVELLYRYDEKRNEHRFAVRDHGIGIAEEDLPRLFTPFTQLDRKHSAHKGTGLGLVYSRKIARLHGGDLQVKSREGEGSIFLFRLPAHSEAAP